MGRNCLHRRSDPTTQLRLADRELIENALEAFTKSHSMADVVQLCNDGDVPCGAINSIEDIFNDPHFKARETMVDMVHEAVGTLTVPNVLPRLSATPGSIDGLGPSLGDWNGDELARILSDDSQIRS